jgi:catechol 2,3-dioxygenase-like lactoylglutathione lyase family enzyme
MSAIHHVTLNVHDPERSARWYADVLGFRRLGTHAGAGFQRILMRHPSGIILGLNRHEHPDADMDFSERRTGLDHLAFQVADREQLEAWLARFDARGVTHSAITPGAVPGAFLIVFRDPDHIQLEVFAPGEPASR